MLLAEEVHMQSDTTPQAPSEEQIRRIRQRHEARAGATYREFLILASAELGVPESRSEQVIRAVLGALEQRLPFDEMSDLASQLPDKLCELMASCDEPQDPRLPREIGRPEFIDMVARELEVGPEEAEGHVRAVFRVLAQTVSRGEIEQVIHLLPRSLRELWPAFASAEVPGP